MACWQTGESGMPLHPSRAAAGLHRQRAALQACLGPERPASHACCGQLAALERLLLPLLLKRELLAGRMGLSWPGRAARQLQRGAWPASCWPFLPAAAAKQSSEHGLAAALLLLCSDLAGRLVQVPRQHVRTGLQLPAGDDAACPPHPRARQSRCLRPAQSPAGKTKAQAGLPTKQCLLLSAVTTRQ